MENQKQWLFSFILLQEEFNIMVKQKIVGLIKLKYPEWQKYNLTNPICWYLLINKSQQTIDYSQYHTIAHTLISARKLKRSPWITNLWRQRLAGFQGHVPGMCHECANARNAIYCMILTRLYKDLNFITSPIKSSSCLAACLCAPSTLNISIVFRTQR